MKRALSFFVLCTIIFSFFSVPAKADDITYDSEFAFVRQLGLFSDSPYDFSNPQESVLRSDYARIIKKIANIDIPMQESGIVTSFEVVEDFVSILGYQARAKYASVSAVAEELGILKKVSVSKTEAITYGEFAALLYNSANVKLLKMYQVGDTVKYRTDEDTFLSGVLGFLRVRGIMTDNGITGLNGESRVAHGQVIIDGDRYLLPDTLEPAMDTIAHSVVGYCTNDKDTDIQTLVYLEIDPAEESESIAFDKFIGLNGNKISYEQENGKVKTRSLIKTPTIIYNGKYEAALTPEMLDYEYGTITLIGQGTAIETIIIEGYVSWVITGVDTANRTIFGGATERAIEGGHTITVNPEASLRIYNADMDRIDFEQLYYYSVVDISKNGDAIKMIISNQSEMNVTLDAMDDKGYYCGDRQYKISRYYTSCADACIPQLGTSYNLYVNNFGYIIKAELGSESDLKVGFLIKMLTPDSLGLLSQGKFKLLTSDNTVAEFNLEEKVTFTDELNETSKLEYPELYEVLVDYQGQSVIQYQTNAAGNIYKVRLPLKKGIEKEHGQLGNIADGLNLYYGPGKGNLQAKLIIDDEKTILFYVNNSGKDDSEKYQALPVNAFSEGYKDIVAYNCEPDSLFAEYMVYIADTGLTSKENYTWLCVTDLAEGLDSYGDKKTIIRGSIITDYSTCREVKYYVDPEILYGLKDCFQTDAQYTVEPGDILRVAVNGDEITDAFMLYDCDAENAFNPSGRRGRFAQNYGCINPADPGKSNPFFMDSNDAAWNLTSPLGYHRVFYGYVYSIDSRGNLLLTTQDLSLNDYQPNYDESVYMTEPVALMPYTNLISLDEWDVTVSGGSLSDIRSYKDVGKDCSRVIVEMSEGYYKKIIVVNGEK